MKTYMLNQDLKLFYVPASSFPNGIKAAFDVLKSKLPDFKDRTFYGISHPGKDGSIAYKAAVNEVEENEGKKYKCETFIVKKGEYITETIMDWQNKMEQITPVFSFLLKDPRIEANGACVEWYKSDRELICMVRLDTRK